MYLKPGDAFAFNLFVNASNGALSNADSTPTLTISHDASGATADDATFAAACTITNVSTGRYRVSGTVPGSGYSAGDVVEIIGNATVGGIASSSVIAQFNLDTKRVSDTLTATASGGSIASVSGAVGSVTGSVGSVSGTVAGIAGVTLPAVVPSLQQIQTGLPSDTSIATDVQIGLTAQGLTAARAGYLDTLNGIVASVWAYASRTLSAFGFSVVANNLPADYQQRGVAITLPTGEDSSIQSDVIAALTAQGYTSVRAGCLDTLSGIVAAIWAYAGRTLSAFGFTPNVGNVGGTLPNVTVGGYAPGQDPETRLKADSYFATLIANTNGCFAFTPPSIFPGTGTLVLKDKTNTTTLATITLGFDDDRNVISRTVA